MTKKILVTKSEQARENSLWLNAEAPRKLDGLKPSSFREAVDTPQVYDLKVLEGGALRRRLSELASRDLAPPVPQASRMEGV